VCVTTTGSRAAAAARIAAGRVQRLRADLMGLLRPCFARTQAWQQAVEYTAVLAGDLRDATGGRSRSTSGTGLRTVSSGC